jgi:uncharacterized protein (DUF433 family)
MGMGNLRTGECPTPKVEAERGGGRISYTSSSIESNRSRRFLCSVLLTGPTITAYYEADGRKGGFMMPVAVTEIVDGETYRYHPSGEHVVSAEGVCGGRPTFKYTRIEVAGILARVKAEGIDVIVWDFEGRISGEAILEAGRISASLSR